MQERTTPEQIVQSSGFGVFTRPARRYQTQAMLVVNAQKTTRPFVALPRSTARASAASPGIQEIDEMKRHGDRRPVPAGAAQRSCPAAVVPRLACARGATEATPRHGQRTKIQAKGQSRGVWQELRRRKRSGCHRTEREAAAPSSAGHGHRAAKKAQQTSKKRWRAGGRTGLNAALQQRTLPRRPRRVPASARCHAIRGGPHAPRPNIHRVSLCLLPGLACVAASARSVALTDLTRHSKAGRALLESLHPRSHSSTPQSG